MLVVVHSLYMAEWNGVDFSPYHSAPWQRCTMIYTNPHHSIMHVAAGGAPRPAALQTTAADGADGP